MSTLPFVLLELNLKSCRDLEPVIKKKCRMYAVVWVNPERKLRTRIDQQGHTNPTWNDKFVFRVDEKFLDSESSTVNIEIYALGWLRDVLVGSARVPITNLIPLTVRAQNNAARRFVTLQIRRPSGRPQGILSMGVTLLDKTMKSMPLDKPATELNADGDDEVSEDSEEEITERVLNPRKKSKLKQNKKRKPKPKPQLRRSNSDKTGLTSKGLTIKASSMVKGGSVINYGSYIKWDKSVVNGPGGSIVNWGMPVTGGGSVVNDGGSVMISDVGPSASVVAAAVARGLYPPPPPPAVPRGPQTHHQQQPGSSILGDWTIEDSSVEGLKTKIDRWRMELPAIYDHRDYQKVQQVTKKTPRRTRTRAKNGSTPGLFSCFGNAYGCEFTIVCGDNGSKKTKRCDSNSNLFSPTELGIK